VIKPFWHQLGDAERDRLGSRGTPVRFRAHDVMLVQGDPGTDVLVISDGLAKVLAHDIRGGQTLLGLRTEGDLVGEMSCLTGEPRTASVIALTDTTAVRIAGAVLREAVGGPSSVAMTMLRMLTFRLRQSDRHREVGGAIGVQRVAATLAEFRLTMGADGAWLRVSQPELAAATSLSLSSVARALATLRHREILRTGQRRIHVLNLEALHAVAAGHVCG
jgi:CRP-like cAMP-binding protein